MGFDVKSVVKVGSCFAGESLDIRHGLDSWEWGGALGKPSGLVLDALEDQGFRSSTPGYS